MARTVKYKAIPKIPETLDEELYHVLSAMKERIELAYGEIGIVGDKRPTVQEMIDAGITNADKIT
jgi:hypothetical protein